jgi:hypothetical protein
VEIRECGTRINGGDPSGPGYTLDEAAGGSHGSLRESGRGLIVLSSELVEREG